MLKKITLAVIGLAASGLVFAGAMGPICSPGNVTVPCESKHWSLGLQALYLNTFESSNRDYRLASIPTSINALNDQWNWGFKAEGSYQYSTGNDVVVSWLHYDGSLKQAGFSTVIPSVPVFRAINNINPYVVYNQSRLDQVNVVMGQHVDFSVTNKMRVYGGLQYANIQENDTNYYRGVLPFPVSNLGGNYYDNSNYKGVGPVVGVDYSYDFTNGLSLIANGSTALLYGTSRLTTGYVLSPANLVVGSSYNSQKTIVPAFDAKLGLNYGYVLAQGVLNVEGGYQVVNYYNVLQDNSLQIPTNPITSSSFGLYGPYVGLKYSGNA